MTQWTLTAALACGLGFFAAASNAADDAGKDNNASGKSFTGILVDNHCGDKLTTFKHAARHPQTCLKNEQCAKTGFQIMVGDKHMKFDEKGNTLAREFIAGDDFTTRVTVMGTPADDGKTITVTSIKATPEVKKDQEKKDQEKAVKADQDENAEKASSAEKPKKAGKTDKAGKDSKSRQ